LADTAVQTVFGEKEKAAMDRSSQELQYANPACSIKVELQE